MFSSLGITLSDLSELPKLRLGDFTLEIEVDPPSAEMQEVARKELRETPEVQKEAVTRLRELLQGSILNANSLIKYYAKYKI